MIATSSLTLLVIGDLHFCANLKVKVDLLLPQLLNTVVKLSVHALYAMVQVIFIQERNDIMWRDFAQLQLNAVNDIILCFDSI